MADKLAWTADGLHRALALSIACWLAFGAIALARPRAALATALAAALLAVGAFAGISALAAVLLLLAGACALGLGLLSRSGHLPRTAADLPLATALGLGIASVVLSAMALAPINTSFTWFVVVASPLLWQGRPMAAMLRSSLAGKGERLPLADLLLVGATGNFVALAIAMALTPEVGNDALALHLAVAAHVRDFGFWHFDVQRQVMAVMPLGADYLYAFGYMFAGETGARLTNVATLVVLLAIVYAAVREAGSRRVALIVTLVAASSPLVLLESASLFVENPWTMLVVGSLVAFERYSRSGDRTLLYAGAALFGAAMSTKVIALGALPGIGLLLLLARRNHPASASLRPLATAAVAAALLALPPYVIAFVKTGNPVFPLFNAIFQSSHFPPRNFSAPGFPGTLDPRVLYRMTFYSDRYLEARPGSFGFSFLLLAMPTLVASLAWSRWRAAAMFFAAVAFGAFVVANTAYLRYLYPCIFLFSIALGAALAAAPATTLRRAMATVALASVALNAAFLTSSFGPLPSFDLRTITDEEQRERYLASWAPVRQLVRVLNALPGDREAVAYLGAPPYVAELRRPAYIDSSYMRSFLGRTASLETREDVSRLVSELDLGYLILGGAHGRRLRSAVESLSTRIASAGDLTLHRVHPVARYPVELLQGLPFEVRPGAWFEHGQVRRDGGGGTIVVDGQNLLYQQVPVRAGERYLLTVRSRCHQGAADLRLQVIWVGQDQRNAVDASVVTCASSWVDEQAVLRAPAWAGAAVVYATGHGAALVELASVSFRSR